jgi:hypothetical protein
MKKRLISRRGFIYAAAGGVAGVGVVGIGSYAACSSRSGIEGGVALRLSVLINEIPQPARLSSWWLAHRPTDALENLVVGGGLGTIAETDCTIERRERFKDLTKEEFRSGRVVVADRIVACEAECLLAAFVGRYSVRYLV